MNNNKKNGLFIFIFIIVMSISQFSLSSCALKEEKTIVLTTGLSKNEVFKVGESVCTDKEMKIFLLNAYGQYDMELINIIASENADISENVKEYCLALVSQIKAMNIMAKNMNITLDEAEKEKVNAAAAAYMSTLNEGTIKYFGTADQDLIASIYSEIALADKTYEYTVRNVNTEISDDEARIITLEQIVIYKSDEAASEKINEAEKRYKSGEDFTGLAGEYNQAGDIRISFDRDGSGDIPEAEAFNLASGEASDIIQTDKAFYLLYCVSSYDKEETRANKKILLERRNKEAFGKIYSEFTKELPVMLNEKLWSEITLPDHNSLIGQSDLWKYYDAIFKEKK